MLIVSPNFAPSKWVTLEYNTVIRIEDKFDSSVGSGHRGSGSNSAISSSTRPGAALLHDYASEATYIQYEYNKEYKCRFNNEVARAGVEKI